MGEMGGMGQMGLSTLSASGTPKTEAISRRHPEPDRQFLLYPETRPGFSNSAEKERVHEEQFSAAMPPQDGGHSDGWGHTSWDSPILAAHGVNVHGTVEELEVGWMAMMLWCFLAPRIKSRYTNRDSRLLRVDKTYLGSYLF
jgi:hypothetical protein